MAKLTILNFDTGYPTTITGSEYELKNELRFLFPEVRGMFELVEMVEALNEDGYVEVHLHGEPDPDDLSRNLYPVDYELQDQIEGPWPREADFNDHSDQPDRDDPTRL
jgi:hypothetical protein